MKILILSACSRFRTPAFLNHQYFSSLHDYDYIYEFLPPKATLQSRYIYKLHVLLKYANYSNFDFIFWVDDDVLFLNFHSLMPLQSILNQFYGYDLIFSESPVHPVHNFKCWINSGNFFFRPNRVVRDFIEECINTNLDEVKRTWDDSKYGPFFGGDQEVMTHVLNNSVSSVPAYTRTDYRLFNTRPYHYGKLDNILLVHFTSGAKARQMKSFAKKNLFFNNVLLPPEILNNYLETCDPLLTLSLRVKRPKIGIWTLWSFKAIFIAFVKLALLK